MDIGAPSHAAVGLDPFAASQTLQTRVQSLETEKKALQELLGIADKARCNETSLTAEIEERLRDVGIVPGDLDDVLAELKESLKSVRETLPSVWKSLASMEERLAMGYREALAQAPPAKRHCGESTTSRSEVWHNSSDTVTQHATPVRLVPFGSTGAWLRASKATYRSEKSVQSAVNSLLTTINGRKPVPTLKWQDMSSKCLSVRKPDLSCYPRSEGLSEHNIASVLELKAPGKGFTGDALGELRDKLQRILSNQRWRRMAKGALFDTKGYLEMTCVAGDEGRGSAVHVTPVQEEKVWEHLRGFMEQ
eukprot:Rhum_TRINITY_DN15393_c4_g1::Rhum_TRINITY_DN15393_c4_g1_i1::g.154247::m.154247